MKSYYKNPEATILYWTN